MKHTPVSKMRGIVEMAVIDRYKRLHGDPPFNPGTLSIEDYVKKLTDEELLWVFDSQSCQEYR